MNELLASLGYAVHEELGRGAFGRVLRATHRPTGRIVALKILETMEDTELADRFLREGRVLAGLKHPGIVQIYEVGLVDRRPYMALELAPGGDLQATRMGRGRVPVAEALRLMLPVADALGHAHRRGVVHRDVKPANIFLDARGATRIGDFGLARAADSAPITVEGQVIGTPRYIAPEMASGEPVGPPADVYALGAILYELLAGGPLFELPREQDVLFAHVYTEPRPLAERCPGVDPALAALVHRCLDKSPAHRPADGAALAQALAALVPAELWSLAPDARAALEARETAAAPRAAPAHRGRSRYLPFAVAAAVLALAWHPRSAGDARPRTYKAQLIRERHAPGGPAPGRHAELSASAPPFEARVRRRDGPAGEEHEVVIVDRRAPAATSPVLEPPFAPVALALAPEYVAVGGAAGQLGVCARDAGRGILAWTAWSGHRAAITTLSVSPDGTELTSTSADGSVRVWSVLYSDSR